MSRHLFIFTSACLLALMVLSGCHTAKKQSVAIRADKPKFIGDIYMNGHNKTTSTTNGIKPVAKTDKTRHDTKTAAPAAEDNAPDEIEMKETPRKLRKKYAELLGVKPKEIDNYPLFSFIDKWYGTNYRLGGSDEDGIDCSGFAQKLYEAVYGVALLRTAMEQYQNCKRVKKPGDAEEGDLVFFKQKSKRITHVGIYLANDYFIHASTSQGVIISSLKEEYWHKHYAGMGRRPGGA